MLTVFLVIVLDTSFLISFYLTSDPNHKKALESAEANKNEIALLSEIILFETLTVLNYKAGFELTKESYNELMSNKQIRFFYFTDQEKDEILQQFFDSNKLKKLSFADVSVIYLAKKSKSEVLAFDEGIINAL